MTEYKIYEDKVEYAEGFLSVSNKIARFNRIVDIRLKQGFLQQKFDLGTIVIDMAGAGNRNTITISDVKDSENIYEKLQNLLAKHS